MSTPPAQPGSILVVDDDATFRGALARSLTSRGYDVWTAANYLEAVGRVLAEPPQFAVVDLKMPGHSGFDLVEEIKHVHPPTTIVVLTADHSPQ
jgi:two-component system response regulator RegA